MPDINDNNLPMVPTWCSLNRKTKQREICLFNCLNCGSRDDLFFSFRNLMCLLYHRSKAKILIKKKKKRLTELKSLLCQLYHMKGRARKLFDDRLRWKRKCFNSLITSSTKRAANESRDRVTTPHFPVCLTERSLVLKALNGANWHIKGTTKNCCSQLQRKILCPASKTHKTSYIILTVVVSIISQYMCHRKSCTKCVIFKIDLENKLILSFCETSSRSIRTRHYLKNVTDTTMIILNIKPHFICKCHPRRNHHQ